MHGTVKAVVSGTDLAEEVARFAADVATDRLAPAVRDAVKANILDILSCALAGSSAPAIEQVAALVREWGGAAQADLFVLGGRFPAHHAAWVNGSMSHARDFDDTHDAAILHAGVTAVPAAIAACQLAGDATGSDLVAAVAAGLEVTCRLGVATQVDIIKSGFIYTALFGHFGATAAAGRALGLTPAEMLNAFGIVYSAVAGNHQVTRDSSLMKRIQPGIAAQAGVVAAQMAKRGIRGVQNVFEGADGFFRVYLQNRIDPAIVRADLGSRFELLNLSYKPYPCCRDVHSAVDAILEIRRRTGRAVAEIESIRVGVTGPGYQMVCVPEAVRLHPRTIVEAQFSIPYTVAAAYIDGALTMEHFSETGLTRSDVLDLARRVAPYVDEEIDAAWSRYVTPARVIARFTDGETIEQRVDYPKGHPNNPMTADEFTAKAANCAAVAARPLAEDTAARLAAAVASLETADDVAALMSVMSPSSAQAGADMQS